VLGIYLGSLGLGAWLSERVGNRLARAFVLVELGVALTGALLAPTLFVLFTHGAAFRVALYVGVSAIGTLVGLEMPLLLRVLKRVESFDAAVARVLTYDYLGSLVGSLLYVMLFAPRLGPLRTGLLLASLNAAVALWSTWVLRAQLTSTSRLRTAALLVLLGIAALFAVSGRIIRRVDTAASLARSSVALA
jgi:spermidine synthase